MIKRTPGHALLDASVRFDRGGDGLFIDGPTELPAPWSQPPDPEFPTGTVLRIERADLRAGTRPGLEPADSEQATVRFSRAEVQALIGVRRPAARRARPPESRAFTPLPPVQYVIGRPPSRIAALLVAHRWLLVQLALAFVLGVLTGVLAVR